MDSTTSTTSAATTSTTAATTTTTAEEEESEMTQRAYTSGREFPPLTPNRLRIYSMRFCPYAQRARMVLIYFNIPHEIVNVNLKNKPSWFLARNSQGTVPVLELNNRVVHESIICCEFLDEVYGQNKLLGKDAYTKSRMKMMVDRFSKVTSVYYSAITKLKNDKDYRGLKAEFEEALFPFEEALTDKYFGGKEPNFVDLMIWPWFERFPAIERLTGVRVYRGDSKLPKLNQWADRNMLLVPVVKEVVLPTELHAEFLRQYADPRLAEPNYDLGLKHQH